MPIYKRREKPGTGEYSGLAQPAPPPPPAQTAGGPGAPPPDQTYFSPAPGYPAGPGKPWQLQPGPKQKGLPAGVSPGQVGMYGDYQLAGKIGPWGELLKSNWTVDPMSGEMLPFSGGWSKPTGSARTGVYKPPYDPTYWENPYNVAREYWRIQSLPPGAPLPEGVNREEIEAAYKYLEFANRDEHGQPRPWIEWKYLTPDDPARGFLQGITMPGPDRLLPAADYQALRYYEEQQKPPAERDARGLPPAYQYAIQNQQYYDQIINSPTVAPDPNRPAWMQFIEGLQEQPAAAGAINMGALGLITGGPVGAFGGALIGGGLGGLSAWAPESGWGVFDAYRRGVLPGAQATIGWTAQQVLSLFNVPASFLEEGLGVGLQFAAAAYDPAVYGDVEEVWRAMSTPSGAPAIDWKTGRTNFFGQAGLAAQSTYESGVIQQALQYSPPQWIGRLLGLDEALRNPDPGNLLQFTEWLVRTKVLGEDLDLRLARMGEVWLPGSKDPVQMNAVGVAALVEARRRLANGEDPEYVSFDTMTRFGLTGGFWDLMGNIVLDPLNVAPTASSKGVSLIGRYVGDTAMELAFRTAAETGKGPVAGFRRYVASIRAGLAGPADQLTAFQRLAAGLDETGRVRAWTDATPASPIGRAFAHIFAMTPEARAREFVTSMADAGAISFDMHRGDPDGMVDFVRRVAGMTPTEAAKMGEMFGSPEMYSGQRAYATFTHQAEMMLEQWHAGDAGRAIVNNLAQVLGETPGDFLTRLENLTDAPGVMRQLQTALEALGTPSARAILDDIASGALTPKSLTDIAATFLGDNAIPLHPDEFQAKLWGAMTTNAAQWATKAFGVKPSPATLRLFDTLKKAQTGILLGWNPGYLINNTVNNLVSRAVAGVGGFADAKTISRFLDRLGVEPYRMRAGAGIADIGLGVSKGGAENVIRAATNQPGFLSNLNRVLDGANKWAPFGAASQHIERAERAQAVYHGMRQGWDGIWSRGRGFDAMPQGLEAALRNIDPRLPDALYAMVEGSMNPRELREKLANITTQTTRYQVSQHLPDVARQLGIDPVIVRDTLRPVMDDLDAQLAKATTPGEVRQAFGNVNRRFQRHVDEMVARDLRTRAEQVGSQVHTAGAAEALRIMSDLAARMDEFWMQHFRSWDEVYAKAGEMRRYGVRPDAFYRQQGIETAQSWARYRAFEKASILGILDGMKFADPVAKQYLGLIEANHKLWGDFYTLKEQLFSEFQDTKFSSQDARNAAWDALRRKVDAAYDNVRGQVNLHNGQTGGLFVEHVRSQFGDAAAAQAEAWRGRMSLLDTERGRLIDQFRASVEGMSFNERRAAWQTFLDNVYKPHIRDFFNAEVEGMHNLYNTATGGMEGPDPAGAPPRPPEGPPPTGGTRPPHPLDDLLNAVDQGGVPAFMTNNLRRTAAQYGINITADMTPNNVVDALRQVRDEQAATSAQPPPTAPAAQMRVEAAAAQFPEIRIDPVVLEKLKADLLGSIDLESEKFAAARAARDMRRAAEQSRAADAPVVGELRRMAEEFKIENPDDAHLQAAILRYGEGAFSVGRSLGDFIARNPDWQQIARRAFEKRAAEHTRAAEIAAAAKAAGEAARRPMSELPTSQRMHYEGAAPFLSNAVENIPVAASGRNYVLITDPTTGQTIRQGVYPDWWSEYFPGKPTYKGMGGRDAVLAALGDIIEGNEPVKPNNQVYEIVTRIRAALDDRAFMSRLMNEQGVSPGEIFVRADFTQALELIAEGKMDEAGALIAGHIDEGRLTDELAQTLGITDQQVGDLMSAYARASLIPGELKGEVLQIVDEYRGEMAEMETIDPETIADGLAVVEDPNGEIHVTHIDDAEASAIAGAVGEIPQGVEVAGAGGAGVEGVPEAARPVEPLPQVDPAALAAEMQAGVNEYAAAHKADPLEDFGPKPPEEGAPAATPAIGPYLPGLAENIAAPRYDGMILSEGWETYTRPMLDMLQERMLASGDAPPIPNVPPELMGQLNGWLGKVDGSMASAKRAALAWGEKLGDEALLNYSERRGFDQYLNMVFPYQFWFTRTAWNWALRMIDRPAWFANWARLRNFFASRPRSGIPSRLAGKMAIPVPFLPAWTGNQVWVDPMRKLFPFEEMTSPIDRIMADKSEDEQRAQAILAQMASAGQVSQMEALAAARNRSGPLWQRALAQAQQQIEEGQSNPMDFLNLVMAPALWITLPYFALTGKTLTGESDMPLLPITRTGQTIQALTQNTPIQALGNLLGGILAAPEGAIRKAAGLSEFGAWGDYYVDRMLANMAADGTFSTREVLVAMMERAGPAYDEARRRVQLETALRTPGALPAYGLLHGAAWNDPVGLATSTLFGWMPAGLLPAGEMEQRGLAEQWKVAREAYNRGDQDALNAFLEAHPEYEARLALYDTPEGRLRQFMISELWDRYASLGSAEKQQVRAALGEQFTTDFLDDDTRSYDTLDLETLAAWTRALGGTVPEARATVPEFTLDPDILPEIQFAPQQVVETVNAYRELRNEQFPNWYALQSTYFSMPEGAARRDFLNRFPELAQYWDWNRGYKAEHPEVEQFTTSMQAGASQGQAQQVDYSFFQEFSPATMSGLIGWVYAGQSLSAGARADMRWVWENAGRPGGDFDTFLEQIVYGALAP
jgi:hypothetical protein